MPFLTHSMHFLRAARKNITIFCVSGLFFLLSLPLYAQQQASPPSSNKTNNIPIQPFDDWAKACGKDNDPAACFMVHEVYAGLKDNKGEEKVLQVIVSYIPRTPETADKAGQVTIELFAQLGVFIPKGVSLTVDNAAPKRFGFIECLPVGCRALGLVDAPLLAQLKSGKPGKVVIYYGNDPLEIPLSLKGFARGFATLKKP
jgi:invasion protein IalB